METEYQNSLVVPFGRAERTGVVCQRYGLHVG